MRNRITERDKMVKEKLNISVRNTKKTGHSKMACDYCDWKDITGT